MVTGKVFSGAKQMVRKQKENVLNHCYGLRSGPGDIVNNWFRHYNSAEKTHDRGFEPRLPEDLMILCVKIRCDNHYTKRPFRMCVDLSTYLGE